MSSDSLFVKVTGSKDYGEDSFDHGSHGPGRNGYEVHGLVRRVALEDPQRRFTRIEHLLDKVTLADSYIECFDVARAINSQGRANDRPQPNFPVMPTCQSHHPFWLRKLKRRGLVIMGRGRY